MSPVRTVEMQCTHAEFLRELPSAVANRPYEIIDQRVVVHDGGRAIQIKLRDEPIRHLASLNLPMEDVTLTFDDYTEKEADEFMDEFNKHVLRLGG